MDLGFSADERGFAEEVRTFVRTNLPADIRARWAETANVLFASRGDTVRWTKILHGRGWSAPNWPREHGGPGWSVAQRFLFDTEMALGGAPPLQNQGLKMIGPVLMAFGTAEQQRRFLPRIAAADDYWCQGYSEPGSGSDLASLSMRAVPAGDDYLVDGSKIWTTCAHEADWIFCLVRTDGSGRKQEGITFLLIDMRSPGIVIRPLPFLGGQHEFNQVFFDGVRVPQANRVGREGQGWEIAKYLLEYERGGAFLSHRVRAHIARVRRAARWAVQNGRPIADDGAFGRRLADIETSVDAMSWTEMRLLDRVARGDRPGPESSITKLLGARLHLEATELAMEAVGPLAVLLAEPAEGLASNLEPPAPDLARNASARYFNHRANSIMGGTDEVQRSVLAKGMLGL
ncbi:MAG: acyl-CoA dehydrogenase family protein [Alphaproteobacteria bacterium]